MNSAELFISAEGLPENQVIGRIAINEENCIGVVVQVMKLKNTLVYLGVDLIKGISWVSLTPMVTADKISLRGASELYYIAKDAMRERLKSKLSMSVSPPMTNEQLLSDMEGATWSKVSFDENTPPEVIQDFLGKLFGDPGSLNNNNSTYNDNDFKIDNEDDDLHNS